MANLPLVAFPKEPQPLDMPALDQAADVGGDEFTNQGTVMFWADNQDSVSTTVTFVAPKKCNFGVLHDAIETVVAGFSGFIGQGFEAARFNDPDNKVQVTYSSVTALSVAAVILGE